MSACRIAADVVGSEKHKLSRSFKDNKVQASS
jgi:hypothetical protein